MAPPVWVADAEGNPHATEMEVEAESAPAASAKWRRQGARTRADGNRARVNAARTGGLFPGSRAVETRRGRPTQVGTFAKVLGNRSPEVYKEIHQLMREVDIMLGESSLVLWPRELVTIRAQGSVAGAGRVAMMRCARAPTRLTTSQPQLHAADALLRIALRSASRAGR